MNKNYKLTYSLVVCLVIVNYFLQSCTGIAKHATPIAKHIESDTSEAARQDAMQQLVEKQVRIEQGQVSKNLHPTFYKSNNNSHIYVNEQVGLIVALRACNKGDSKVVEIKLGASKPPGYAEMQRKKLLRHSKTNILQVNKKNKSQKKAKHNTKKPQSTSKMCNQSMVTHTLNYNGSNLQNINLSGLCLREADFTNANLKGADLSGSNLKGANFTNSNLQGVKFKNTQLQKARFCYADLTDADLTNANINGAKFKGACLYNINYSKICTPKGTLFADKEQLTKKLEIEKEIELIKQEFINNNKANLITLEPMLDFAATIDFIHAKLDLLVKAKRKYIILDFRKIYTHNDKLEHYDYNYFFKECSNFLQALFFRAFVKNIIPICNNKGLIVFLNTNIQGNTTKNTTRLQTHLNGLHKTKLDLHGKIPVHIKYKWIDSFIKTSYKHNHRVVEIITGRGLHNPDGKMGMLWHTCKTYLLHDKFRPYIQEIHSTSKNGGWKVILKDSAQIVKNAAKYARMVARSKKQKYDLLDNK